MKSQIYCTCLLAILLLIAVLIGEINAVAVVYKPYTSPAAAYQFKENYDFIEQEQWRDTNFYSSLPNEANDDVLIDFEFQDESLTTTFLQKELNTNEHMDAFPQEASSGIVDSACEVTKDDLVSNVKSDEISFEFWDIDTKPAELTEEGIMNNENIETLKNLEERVHYDNENEEVCDTEDEEVCDTEDEEDLDQEDFLDDWPQEEDMLDFIQVYPEDILFLSPPDSKASKGRIQGMFKIIVRIVRKIVTKIIARLITMFVSMLLVKVLIEFSTRMLTKILTRLITRMADSIGVQIITKMFTRTVTRLSVKGIIRALLRIVEKPLKKRITKPISNKSTKLLVGAIFKVSIKMVVKLMTSLTMMSLIAETDLISKFIEYLVLELFGGNNRNAQNLKSNSKIQAAIIVSSLTTNIGAIAVVKMLTNMIVSLLTKKLINAALGPADKSKDLDTPNESDIPKSKTKVVVEGSTNFSS